MHADSDRASFVLLCLDLDVGGRAEEGLGGTKIMISSASEPEREKGTPHHHSSD